MSTCIAAVFKFEETFQLVLCHDWRGTDPGIGSSDELDKQRWIGVGWSALIAGNTAYAEELCLHLEAAFATAPPTEQSLLSTVREAVFAYKKVRINQHLGSVYGIDFETLLTNGKAIFPEEIFRQIHQEISRIYIGVDLLITGYVESTNYDLNAKAPDPVIVRVLGHDGCDLEVSISQLYDCIGEGATAAKTSLITREYDPSWGLKRAIYSVYEAKIISEVINSVGESTSLYIQLPDGTLKYLKSDSFDKCNAMLTAFGPRKFTKARMKKHSLNLTDFSSEAEDAAKLGSIDVSESDSE
jgi:hypothetical protein